MNTTLFSLTAKPQLWQRSPEPFWDDSYISEQMLAAHLNGDNDLASRCTEVIERSVEWLLTLIPTDGKVLDLGCGPGLYTSRLSKMGYDVTGVDLSKRSISYAKETDNKTKYFCSDYLAFDTAERFDVITLIYCDYAALTKPERLQLLAKVKSMLKSGGKFIFDVFTPKHYEGKTESNSWYSCESGGFWSAEPHLCLDATYLYENNTVSADCSVVITDDGAKEYIIWDTVFTKQSLCDELESAGLFAVEFFGDICGKEYDDNSETLCCVASDKKIFS